MAEIIGASDPSAFAVLGRNVTNRLSGASASGTRSSTTLALPDGTALGGAVRGELSLFLGDVRGALELALRAGGAILNALTVIKNFTDVAARESLVSSEAGINPGGTRLSRSNLSAQARLALRRINELVETSGLAGANLISSTGRTVNVVTTNFGGRIAIQPQPLDTPGLGLNDFSLLFQSDVNRAVSTIRDALTVAELRVERLQALQNALANPNPFNANLARVVSNGQEFTLPRGSLVDVVG